MLGMGGTHEVHTGKASVPDKEQFWEPLPNKQNLLYEMWLSHGILAHLIPTRPVRCRDHA